MYSSNELNSVWDTGKPGEEMGNDPNVAELEKLTVALEGAIV